MLQFSACCCSIFCFPDPGRVSSLNSQMSIFSSASTSFLGIIFSVFSKFKFSVVDARKLLTFSPNLEGAPN